MSATKAWRPFRLPLKSAPAIRQKSINTFVELASIFRLVLLSRAVSNHILSVDEHLFSHPAAQKKLVVII